MSALNIIAVIFWGIAGYINGRNDGEFQDRDGMKNMAIMVIVVLVAVILERMLK